MNVRRLLFVVGLLGAAPALWGQESVRTVAGRADDPGASNGPALASRFRDPAGLAVDVDGTIFIADSANHCIRRLGRDGSVVTLIGKPGEAGSADGNQTAARLDSPAAVAVGGDGTLYIADTGNHTIRKFAGGRLTLLAGMAGDPGPTNGIARTARFNAPLGLVVTANNTLFVADSGNHAVRQITPDGTVSTLAGALEEWGARDGLGDAARFYGPVGLALTPTGLLLVSDSLNHAVRQVTPAGEVTTIAGQLGTDGSVDGPALTARFCQPAGLTLDRWGNLYVVDAFPHLLRKIGTNGMVSTVAGRPGEPGAADGVNGQGRFFNPYGIVVRPNGAVIVSDTYNATLREILPPFSQSLERQPTTATLRWESIIGIPYQVQVKDTLEAEWTPLTAPRTATAPNTAYTLDALAPHAASKWFRVQRLE